MDLLFYFGVVILFFGFVSGVGIAAAGGTIWPLLLAAFGTTVVITAVFMFRRGERG